jgi:hypothetical protein
VISFNFLLSTLSSLAAAGGGGPTYKPSFFDFVNDLRIFLAMATPGLARQKTRRCREPDFTSCRPVFLAGPGTLKISAMRKH